MSSIRFEWETTSTYKTEISYELVAKYLGCTVDEILDKFDEIDEEDILADILAIHERPENRTKTDGNILWSSP